MTPEDILDKQPVTATVTQCGRWWYRVLVTRGWFPVYDKTWPGRARAERIAQRKVDRYVRRQTRREQWKSEATKIKAEP